ncbi:hypothetical protein POM88_024475 [Heracleum sosnowskyi]|uniref:F-box domain-containing protein n=1 Tax=Heracleum sosnowskyi TaxID=360622 RepID=A0AAD8MLH2_9APIA|nr:hypothetical protein POM88_024475 [Heracleum sosnowskyi]
MNLVSILATVIRFMLTSILPRGMFGKKLSRRVRPLMIFLTSGRAITLMFLLVVDFFCYGCYGIITFDLHTDVIYSPAIKYPVPTFKAQINNFDLLDATARITNFKDSVNVGCKSQDSYNAGFYHMNYKLNLWALDDKACLRGGGIQASWTLIYNIRVKLPLNHVHGYLNTGHLLLLLYGQDWCLYSLNRKRPRYFINKYLFGEVFKYTKSIFTIPGFKQLNTKMSSSEEMKMRRFTGNVPEDMVPNILLRLDAKTLVGFKSVSKTWLALISSPHFAKSRLVM